MLNLAAFPPWQLLVLSDVLTISVGLVVATVQPRTWLKALLYGDTLPAGTTGDFTPANGGNLVSVTLRGALGVSQPDGGLPVALITEHAFASGAFGTVTLGLPAQSVSLVPSEALILDKGQWWVMAHTPQGDHPVQVTPVPPRNTIQL